MANEVAKTAKTKKGGVQVTPEAAADTRLDLPGIPEDIVQEIEEILDGESVLDGGRILFADDRVERLGESDSWRTFGAQIKRKVVKALATSLRRSESEIGEILGTLALDLPAGVPASIQRVVYDLVNGALGMVPASRLLVELGAAADWRDVPPISKAIVSASAGRVVGSRDAAAAALGRYDARAGAWVYPRPADSVEENDGVVAFNDMGDAEPAAMVARGLAFAGTVGFLHGAKAQGKTTACATAACAVSQGRDFAGAPTIKGSVLVVHGDDPRTWQILVAQNDAADTLKSVPAGKAVRQLPQLIAKYRPIWIIIDNLRSWGGAANVRSYDESAEAAGLIDPICEAVRNAGYPVAVTVLHNQGRSKHLDGYNERLRNSTVFEDAVDWICACSIDPATRTTTITHGEKTRIGIPTETFRFTLGGDDVPGPQGGPTGGGGGHLDPDDPAVHPRLQRDADAVYGYLMQVGPQSQHKTATAAKLHGRAWPRFLAAVEHLAKLGLVSVADGPRGARILSVSATGSGSVYRGGQKSGTSQARATGSTPGTSGGTSAEPVPGTSSTPIGEPVPGTRSRNQSSGTSRGSDQGVERADPDQVKTTANDDQADPAEQADPKQEDEATQIQGTAEELAIDRAEAAAVQADGCCDDPDRYATDGPPLLDRPWGKPTATVENVDVTDGRTLIGFVDSRLTAVPPVNLTGWRQRVATGGNYRNLQT